MHLVVNSVIMYGHTRCRCFLSVLCSTLPCFPELLILVAAQSTPLWTSRVLGAGLPSVALVTPWLVAAHAGSGIAASYANFGTGGSTRPVVYGGK